MGGMYGGGEMDDLDSTCYNSAGVVWIRTAGNTRSYLRACTVAICFEVYMIDD